MKNTLFKKNDVAKVLLLALTLVGFTSYVFSAPPPGSTPGNYGNVVGGPGYIADIIDFGSKPQAKDCVGGAATATVLTRVTLSLCHNSRPAPLMIGDPEEYSFGAQGITSSGPITAQGKLFADLSQMVGTSGAVRDALRLTTGKNNNITTIATNKNIVGVWSNFLSTWANGRFGRLDVENLVLTEMTPFRSYPFGPLKQAGVDDRAVSYTTSVAGGTLTNIDVAGTTNLGLGNNCFRKYRDCTGGANGAGGGNMYINRIGSNYVSCRDIDPAEYPQVTGMSDPGYFTCDQTRVAPNTSTINFGYMKIGNNIAGNGYDYPVAVPTPLCSGNYAIKNTAYSAGLWTDGLNTPGLKTQYRDSDDDVDFGTYIFEDPYLERPVRDGWHSISNQNASKFPSGTSYIKTDRGAISEIAVCSVNQPPNTTPWAAVNAYLYNY